MHEQLQYLCRSIAFLSRIPVPNNAFDGDDGKFHKSSSMFALAGVVIGVGPAFLAALLLYTDAQPLLVSIMLLATIALITGALHEDGLSDSIDGLWSGRSRTRILEIMHDSRIGAFGTLGLIFSTSIKIAAVAHLASHLTPSAFFITIISVLGISRAAMVYHWYDIPPAREDGVAAHVGQPDELSLSINLLLSCFLGATMLAVGHSLLHFVIAIGVTGLSIYYFTRYVDKSIDGHTGDTIGATQQISEILLLLFLALWI